MRKLFWVFIFCFSQVNLLGRVDEDMFKAQRAILGAASDLIASDGEQAADDINISLGILTALLNQISPAEDIGDVSKDSVDEKRDNLFKIIELLDGVYARCIEMRDRFAPDGQWIIEIQRMNLEYLGNPKILECFENIIRFEASAAEKIRELLIFWQDKLDKIAAQGVEEQEKVKKMQEEAAKRLEEQAQKIDELNKIEREKEKAAQEEKEREKSEQEALAKMKEQQDELEKQAKDAEQKRQLDELRKQQAEFKDAKASLRKIIDEMKANKAIAEAHKNEGIKKKPKKTAMQAKKDFVASLEALRPYFGRNLTDATAPLFLEAFEIVFQAMDVPWRSKSEKTEITNPLILLEQPGVLNVEASILSASGRNVKTESKKVFRLLNAENEQKLKGIFEDIKNKKADITMEQRKQEPAKKLPPKEPKKEPKPIEPVKPAQVKITKVEVAPPLPPEIEEAETKVLRASLANLKRSLQDVKNKTELLQGKLVLLRDKLS